MADKTTKRMTLILDGEVAGDVQALVGIARGDAARTGCKAPTIGEVVSELLRKGLRATAKESQPPPRRASR